MVHGGFVDAIAATYYEDNDDAIVPMVRMGTDDATVAS